MTATCRIRGCGQPTAGPRFTACAQCLLGNKPHQRRRDAAFAAVAEAAPIVRAPAGATSFDFVVPGVPVTKNDWHEPVRRHGKATFLVTPKARAWMQWVALCGARAKPPGWPMEAAYGLELLSVFISPRADNSGPLELVKDALQGVLWDNDVRVKDTRCRIGPADAAHARLEVSVHLLPKEGA